VSNFLSNENFGNKVDGYDVRVINEREARAAAGLLFAFGMISFLNSFMLGNFAFTQFFVGFFMIDFMVRVINPNYAPSMLAGRVFIQNQTPEYVGAEQKRFAWSIGLALSIPMFYLVAIDPQMNPIKIVICVVCLLLLFSESAFSICLGCKVYHVVKKKKATHCPGDVCEIKQKDDVQRFSLWQKSIVTITTLFVVVSLYNFTVNTPHKSMALNMLPMMLMSDEEKQAMQEAEYERQMEKEFADEEDEGAQNSSTNTGMKCGAGKCGGSMKCGGAMKCGGGMKCGAGKCGGSK
jgi:hypothetical protein